MNTQRSHPPPLHSQWQPFAPLRPGLGGHTPPRAIGDTLLIPPSEMSDQIPSRRVGLASAVRKYRGFWDTRRALSALRDAGHDPQPKHTRRILRDLASDGLLVKVEDWPVRYRTEPMDAGP